MTASKSNTPRTSRQPDTFRVCFKRAQIEPVAAYLRAIGTTDGNRPRSTPPDRWAKLLAGKVCQLTLPEVASVAAAIGYDSLFWLADLGKDPAAELAAVANLRLAWPKLSAADKRRITAIVEKGVTL